MAANNHQILNSWTALAASLSLALPSGGPTSVLWGLLTAGVGNLCLASSLAEFLSVWPTASGQYFWSAAITPRRWMPIVSYLTGWINAAGWVALTATGGLLGSQLIMGVISLYSPTFVAQRWEQFLIYIGYTVFAFVVNAFANRALPYVNQAAFIWSLLGFVVICITVLACSSPNYASGDFVFRLFLNETGWPDGIAWLLGLLQGGLGLTGYDAVAHMIEEIVSDVKPLVTPLSADECLAKCYEGRSKSHDILRLHRSLHRLHLPHGPVVRFWWQRPGQ